MSITKTRTPRDKLKERRLQLGLTQAGAGDLIGVTAETIAWYEAGNGGRVDVVSKVGTLCRAYRELARERGYALGDFHESTICPDLFPPRQRNGEPSTEPATTPEVTQ